MLIEKGVPTPTETTIAAIPDLEVGDSFLVKKDADSIVKAVSYFLPKYPKITYDSDLEIVDGVEMVRLWRTS